MTKVIEYMPDDFIVKDPMDEVSQIRERIDIVSFISEYIPLKKMGRNFKANCPFHQEKTPSFIVSPERQIWHCFGGCSKGGDVFSFLMEYEKLEFVEALRILAKRAGVALRESAYQKGVSSKKEKIYALNRLVADFYNFVLTKHKAGEKALSYLLKIRKIDERLIDTFMIGYSPKDGVSLSNYLINKKKFKQEDLVEAGLAFYRGPSASSGQARVLDFFRDRIMFPLIDHRGNVLGFSGRAIDANAIGGKYINTRETFVYHKSDMFFGLNIAKDEIKIKDKAIVVEGEFDVISSYKEGIKNTIAVKGTSLTDNQALLLHRFTNNICLCFDRDLAGLEATKRSLVVLEKKGFNITVAVFENGKDADEAIKDNPRLFKKALKENIAIYDFLFSHAITSHDKNTVIGKRKISSEFLPIISNIENEIVKEFYLKKLGLELDISIESLVRELERIQKKEVIKVNIKTPKQRKSRLEILEEYLISLVIQHENPKIVLENIVEVLSDYQFKSKSYKKIIDYLLNYYEKNAIYNNREFLKLLPPELIASFDTCFLYPLPKFKDLNIYINEASKIASELRNLYIKEKIKKISKDFKEDQEKELTYLTSLLSKASLVVK